MISTQFRMANNATRPFARYMLFVSFLFSSALLFSQTKDRLHFGLKFGGYTGLYKGDNYYSKNLGYDIGSKTLAHLGVFFEIPLAKNLALQPEVLFYEGGYRWISEAQFDATGKDDYDVVERLVFVSVPVLLKYKVGGLGVYLGVEPDYLVSLNREIDGRPVSIADDFKKHDYKRGIYMSGIGGIEYTFGFGLGVSARYQLGLTNIAKATEYGIYEQGNKINTNAFLYGIHWRFGRVRKSS